MLETHSPLYDNSVCCGLTGFSVFNLGFEPGQLFRVSNNFDSRASVAILALPILAYRVQLVIRVSVEHKLFIQNRQEYSVRLSSQNVYAIIPHT